MCLKIVLTNVKSFINNKHNTPSKEILWGNVVDKNLIHQTQYTQPALFVIEYALAKLWQSIGVQPAR